MKKQRIIQDSQTMHHSVYQTITTEQKDVKKQGVTEVRILDISLKNASKTANCKRPYPFQFQSITE